MKYFTRELYQEQQGDPDLPKVREAEKKWETALKEYKECINHMKSSLSTNLQAFSDLDLHDGLIETVSMNDDNLVIAVDCRETAVKSETLELTFRGIESVKGIENIVDDCWLYEEIFLLDSGKFKLNVLLEKSEIEIIAEEVEVKQ